MTPKEKAKELFLKFNNATLAYDSGDHTAEGINESIMLMVKESKRCALIAVDEMIIQNGELYLIGVNDEKLLNYYRVTNSFLFQVKEEIEKL